MPKYFFLYKNESYTRDTIFQSDCTKQTEEEARQYFEKHYNAKMVAIRKGRRFSKAEVSKMQKQHRYA